MYVIDADVWVNRMLPHEPRHEESSQFLRRVHEEPSGHVFVPALALPEVSGAIGRRLRPGRGRRALTFMLSLRFVIYAPVDRALAQASALLAADLGLRGADAVYVALAQARRVPLVTWDNELLVRAAPAVTALTPTQVLSS